LQLIIIIIIIILYYYLLDYCTGTVKNFAILVTQEFEVDRTSVPITKTRCAYKISVGKPDEIYINGVIILNRILNSL